MNPDNLYPFRYMRAKVVKAYNPGLDNTGYMVMVQESKGKKYKKGLKVNGIPFFTTDRKEANEVVKEFNSNEIRI